MVSRRNISRGVAGAVAIIVIAGLLFLSGQIALQLYGYNLGPFLAIVAGLLSYPIVDKIIAFTFKPEALSENKEPARISSSEAPFFHTELFPTQGLRIGDQITFRATFRGELKRGAFSTLATPPKGREFGIPCEKTFRQGSRGFLMTGKLNGQIDSVFEWHWQIPEKTPFGERTPFGEWTLSIRAYQRTPFRNWWVSVRIWLIIGLKRWIDAIDPRALDQPKWPWIREEEHKVIIGPKKDTVSTRVNP